MEMISGVSQKLTQRLRAGHLPSLLPKRLLKHLPKYLPSHPMRLSMTSLLLMWLQMLILMKSKVR